LLRGKVEAVETNKGRIECEKVVDLFGALARELAQTAGIDLPVRAAETTARLGTKRTEIADKNAPMVIDLGQRFHFRPARDFKDSTNCCDIPNEIFFAYADEKPSFRHEF
jgi:glycine/D-amino acid oxidase-like deaminating enzyme